MKNADGHVVPSLRDMWAPRCINHTSGAAYPSQVPDMMCEDKDNMGVHFNSLIPGRLFAVFSDGYGTTVNGVGVERALSVFIRAKFLSIAPTTFKMYAQNLRTACSQLVGARVNDHTGKRMPPMPARVCTQLTKAIKLVSLDAEVPCFTKQPVLVLPDPYRVLVHRNSDSMVVVAGRGNFSGFSIEVNGARGAECGSMNGQHPWEQFTDVNPVWTWTIRCPVVNPVSHGFPEPGYGSVRLLHDNDVRSEYNVLWAPIPKLEWAQMVPDQGIIFNGTDLWLNMSVVFTIGLDFSEMFVYGALCPTPQEMPSKKNGCIILTEGTSDWTTGAFTLQPYAAKFPRNRYNFYISQHKGFYWSNAVVLNIFNATTDVRICVTNKKSTAAVPGATVVLSEPVFGGRRVVVGSDGCVTTTIEQEVDYRAVVMALGYATTSKLLRIDNTTSEVLLQMNPIH
eukprot:m51a1_g13634 hypothetical protein (452) ;mRNA; f:190-1591